MIVIAKWLGQVAPDSMEMLAMGTYLVTLCVLYHKLSKRYIPEAINKLLQALVLLSPSPSSPVPGTFPIQDLLSLRISKSPEWTPRKLSFSDIFGGEKDSKLAILHTALKLLTHLADLWVGKNSFTEVFTPVSSLLSHLSTTTLPPALTAAISATSDKISTGLNRSRQLRRPLEFHHRRPLPIPSHMPKFEESYSMDKKSYDPDRDRAELAKLKAQHKKERKGAPRELRKDSSFIVLGRS
ncbi:nucleolar complex protein 14 [Rhizina undulata]